MSVCRSLQFITMRLFLASLCLLAATAIPAAAMATGLMQQGRFPEQGMDADRDGVADIDDNCAGTMPTTLVRGKPRQTTVDICGCPVDPCTQDSDKDGINDCDDLCPATARGLVVLATGCPKPQTKPQVFVLDVKFAFAEARLQAQYVPDLDKLRGLLLRFPDLKLTLEGHTDAIGSLTYNQALSQARADKCRKYVLSDPRIAPARIKAIGYGKTRPLVDNKDDAGRAQNRRTVAALSYLFEFIPPNNGEALPR